MLTRIRPPPGFSNEVGLVSEEVIDLSRERILVRDGELATALHRLRSLVASHPNPGLCKRLLFPLPLSLWALASWSDPEPSVAERFCTPAQGLLEIYLKLTPSPGLIMHLVQNLAYRGGYDRAKPEWVYKTMGNGKIEIVDGRHLLGITNAAQVTLEEIDRKAGRLLDIITASHSDADISAAFLELLKKWISSTGKHGRGGIVIKEEQGEQDPVVQMAEMKILQGMMEKFPEKLATQPKHILDLVSQILASSATAPDGEDNETIGVALSLLNMIVTAPGFQKAKVDPEILSLIESSLETLSKAGTSDLSQTATNLSLLLKYRDEIEPPSSSSSTTTAPTNRQIEDRKTYSLAISYITQPDSPPPVRAEGLNLIATLITSHSPALDIPGILVLLSSLVADPAADADEYIYLHAIKLYVLLANKHPRAVTTELIDHFVDPRETHPRVDARLRFGEALLQVVQRMGETFTGEIAQRVGDALLSVAGRRGKRAKTERRQERERRAREKKNKEAAEVWGGEVPDFGSEGEEEEGMTEEEKRRNEVLEQIVEGWESKRGSEDVRVRASALGVLGAAVETNVAGLGQAVVARAVDLCVAVLQMERDVEKGILRRAAVMFVMSFVRALDEARRGGKRLGFGFGSEAQEDVMRTLRYVAETDNDGLVVQHARDVVESLENWQVVRLLPPEGGGDAGLQGLGGGLTRLAGLEIDPERSIGAQEDGRPRPRIEEIE